MEKYDPVWLESVHFSVTHTHTIQTMDHFGNGEKETFVVEISFIWFYVYSHNFLLARFHSHKFAFGQEDRPTKHSKTNKFGAFHFLWVIILILKYLWMGFSYLFGINYSYASAFRPGGIYSTLRYHTVYVWIWFGHGMRGGKKRKTHQITYVMNIVDGFLSLSLSHRVPFVAAVFGVQPKHINISNQFFSVFFSILIILPHIVITLWAQLKSTSETLRNLVHANTFKQRKEWERKREGEKRKIATYSLFNSMHQ